MVNNSTNDIDRIVDHHCLEVIVNFVDIGRIVDHHCLEVIVCFADIGRINNHL
jgi:(2Fe-2S) ferredoxin